MTTLQTIKAALDTITVLGPNKVSYGYNDSVKPPFLVIANLQKEPIYTICGVDGYFSNFTVTAYAKTLDQATELAEQVIDAITVTLPQALGNLQTSEQVATPDLYIWSVSVSFRLLEGVN